MLGSSARKMDSRTRLFFLPGSGAVFSFSQTRPWLVFRCYVNFFLSRSGPAREKWALGPDFSHFSGLARENQSLGPGLSFFPGLARHFLSPRPDHDLFLALCKLLFLPQGSNARKMGSWTRFVFLPGSNARKYGLLDPFCLPSQVQRTKIRLPAPTFLSSQVRRTKISHTARPKLVFRHYVNLFSRATHYNIPNEYPCVCAASIRSPSNAAFVADSACSR